ncbi:MAG: adenylate cyclase [Desulforhopalus sp.]|jgi:adenylate cyclase
MLKKKPLISCSAPNKISADAIRNQLQRILASIEFTATESQRKFLTFVVLETLAGNSNEIKGFTVATRVFGRGDDFDQATDPIVSIQANKLRRALERYYLVTGHNDPIRIGIPKGTYIPVFTQQSPDKSVAGAMSGTDRASGVGYAWPTILICPFLNLTGDTALDWLGPGFASELRMEITQQRDIKVLRGIPAGDGKQSTDTSARFVIDGEILKDVEGIQVIVTLTDTLSNLQLWSNRLNCGNDPSLLIGFQKIIVQTVAAQIGCEQGIIAKTILAESTDKAPENLKTYEAILRFIEYFQDPTKERFIQALDTLEHARKLEPLCGKIWSMLARLHIIIYAYEIPGFAVDDARTKAISYAEKGAKLAPDNQFARVILAFIRMITDEKTAAGREVQTAYDLCPDSVVLMDTIGYVMALTGKWEQGSELIRKAIRRNPYYPNYVHYALWANWIRQKDYEQAYQETMHLRNPQVFWEPLVKAATLGHLGRLEEGQSCIADLLALKPDFPSRGYILIERFIKFKDIADSTVSGLKKCGLEFVS